MTAIEAVRWDGTLASLSAVRDWTRARIGVRFVGVEVNSSTSDGTDEPVGVHHLYVHIGDVEFVMSAGDWLTRHAGAARIVDEFQVHSSLESLEDVLDAAPALPTEPGLYVSAAWYASNPVSPILYQLTEPGGRWNSDKPGGRWNSDKDGEWWEIDAARLPADLVPLAPRVEPTPLEVTDAVLLTALNAYSGQNKVSLNGHAQTFRVDMRDALEAVFAAVAKGGA